MRKHRFTVKEIDAMSDPLRQAVAWRILEGKLKILHFVTGISEEKLREFAETGQIDVFDRMTLERFK